jgi:acyl-CoA thioesterase-1
VLSLGGVIPRWPERLVLASASPPGTDASRCRVPRSCTAGAAILAALALSLSPASGGCRRSGPSPEGRDAGPPRSGPPAESSPDPRPVVLFVGDSLTAGLGVDPSQAFPARIQEKIDAAGLGYRVVNAGVSGETSAGALRRMDWLLRQKVAVLVLETGANDGLRGQDPQATRANIQAIFDLARRQDPPPKLLLVAMEALPNYGEDYRRRFRALYYDLAKANGVVLVPFLLDGVAGVPGLNQADGIHPTAEGHRRVAENVWKVLEPLLRPEAARVKRSSSRG